MVVDANTGQVVGVYNDRTSAQNRADVLQRVTYARFS